jgi:hypothetical protein
MKKNKIDKEIKEHFKQFEIFSREELFEYYRKYENDLKPQTFAWRLYDLKHKNIIQEIKKGYYKVSDKKLYKPTLDEKIKEIYYNVTKEFYDSRFVVWSSSWLNEFTLHQTFQNFYLFESSYETTESVFYKMKELGIPNVFLRPDKEQIAKYAIGMDSPIIITNLIMKAPVKKMNKILVPTLEKILVDLYSDQNTFYMYQGNELREIFRNALKKYLLNYTKLFHYARRRGKEIDLKNFIEFNFKEHIGDLLND